MTPSTRRAAVLGHPIAHSLSPVLHRAAYRALGLDWEYDARDVTPDALPAFLQALDDTWVGLSLTMPLKETVLPLLTSVAADAALVRAVNTVVLGDGGSRHGANTDIAGLGQVLAEAGAPVGTAVTVLGGGATARSTLAAVAARGAGVVTAGVRRPEAGAELAELGRALGVELRAVPLDSLGAALAAPLVVSAVPAGVTDRLVGLVPRAGGVLVDVVYDPWPTPLAAAWSTAGGTVVGGLELLVHQAVEQVRLMTGRQVAAGLLRRAGAEALAARG